MAHHPRPGAASAWVGPDLAPQRVWQHSRQVASDGEQLDLPDQALALLRMARHDADTLTHALGLGRSQARHPSNDETTRRGVRLLETAIAYLGQSMPRPML